LIIPFLSYGFLGVEIVSVTAFEAKSPRTALRSPSKFIAYIIVALFFLCGIGEALNLPWNAAGLTELSDAKMKKRADSTIDNTAGLKHTSSALVLAAERAGDLGLAGFFNACLIYSCLSAANTALYVSSRTLYGLCREVDPDDTRIIYRLAAKLGELDPRTRVPIWSIVLSVLAFFWVPFLHVWNRNSVGDVSS
jgi:amino acid transporter